MQIESELYSALLDAGVSKEKAERVADALSKSIDQRYEAHSTMLATKSDIEALRADVFKALTDQTWKLAGIVLAGMAFVVAALRFAP
ncbi:hypothetical protein D8B23_07935 [Verminephrobacter aporrectodeae subsp. tuberculatae]|uniref:DUF1640 domain-containing protein n=1 Tax=Verminephrobacter aporrectodeae subsp. tuberculatae TaxID=1110392 RepID=A0ABT3KNN4_9BURK|nr:hypothetical protein [Verminephrobacter aporrectodeae]MCW5221170.1 hypothetical protein [Verminephrobacter aporrectodeae subsp. tuberculatae]MCW5290461.1 hypothetical protein [Verminephrobacter aporrectodeae subsp. tuberculatae]MCW5319762.1 hypothetical protein [Verminephrobacter aporrectodeae subsp. tuberculatae]MCW8165536.1 hypothetical protein [Verminephrobacter aporrectodeae subsp. tuberculatae]MCW8170625.1 hypothetical protein [Verminephrobacter aporrectodeae subsp. tuberculatae]